MPDSPLLSSPAALTLRGPSSLTDAAALAVTNSLAQTLGLPVDRLAVTAPSPSAAPARRAALLGAEAALQQLPAGRSLLQAAVSVPFTVSGFGSDAASALSVSSAISSVASSPAGGSLIASSLAAAGVVASVSASPPSVAVDSTLQLAVTNPAAVSQVSSALSAAVSGGTVAKSVSRSTGANVSLTAGTVGVAIVTGTPPPPAPAASPRPPARPPPPFPPPAARRVSCDSVPGPCFPGVTCSFPTARQAGAGINFVCGACPRGYQGNGVGSNCTDIDECASSSPPCDPHVSCANTQGGYLCGECPSFFRGSGYTGCFELSECAVDNGGCHPNRICTDGPDGSICGCADNRMKTRRFDLSEQTHSLRSPLLFC